MSEQNKAVVRRVFEAFNTGKLDLLDGVMEGNVADDNPGQDQTPGLEGVKQHFRGYLKGFPDLCFKIEDVIAEGDKVAVRYTFEASHTGDFFGLASTGRKVAVPGLDLYRLANGKIVEQWGGLNQLSLRQQLGVSSLTG